MASLRAARDEDSDDIPWDTDRRSGHQGPEPQMVVRKSEEKPWGQLWHCPDWCSKRGRRRLVVLDLEHSM